ncbi:MAG: nucleotidyltransferase domain-containing protein [Bacteroidales bacterium]|nr:nucleotidyltransferase domain-containing protein [Bacteroidales bacterium]
MSLSFNEIRSRNLLIYEYIRGSHCHGINTPQSDVDHGGVFLAPLEQILGLGLDYTPLVESAKSDDVWYELTRFFQLLLKSNPTILESLFIPDRCVIYESNIIKEIKSHRDMFLTKQCFNPFGGYAVSQIKKARGLQKKIVNPMTERLTPLEFCYTFYKQGSTEIKYWLEVRGLYPNYCGLTSINNMRGVYGCYYDFGKHFKDFGISFDSLSEHRQLFSFLKGFWRVNDITDYEKWFQNNSVVRGYSGILRNDDSNQLSLSSISKGEIPICNLAYNADGYTSHCIKYNEYQDWVKNRNPIRYESNLDKNYDSKNMCECFRLMQMCIEIARGDGLICDRTGIDRDFLLNIRAHKFEYDELMHIVEDKKVEMDAAIASSTLPDKVDSDFLNNLLLKIRRFQIG